MDNRTKVLLIGCSICFVIILYGTCCPTSRPYKYDQYIKRCHARGDVIVDGKCAKVILVEP